MPQNGTYSELAAWLEREISRLDVHRLLRPYVRTAVENVLDVHEAMEQEIGSMRLLRYPPEYGVGSRTLVAWAPLYTTASGIREIRRLRYGSARSSESEEAILWAHTAAMIAAMAERGREPHATLVRVVEVGMVDGSTHLLFAGSVDEARDQFGGSARDRARALADEDHVVPCGSCGACKVAGACNELIPADGMLGQATPGLLTRSVSAHQLTQYRQCPGQWLLDSECHLPKEIGSGEAQYRGILVHKWLHSAHLRGHACAATDLPADLDGTSVPLADISDAEYATIRPYLLQHLRCCPLSHSDVEVIAAEETLYGFDRIADVVVAVKPDVFLRKGDRLVLREVKTAAAPLNHGSDEAFDKYLQVPFMLRFLVSGLLATHQVTAGDVEIELLTPDSQDVWRWSTDDGMFARLAEGEVRRAAEEWHVDRKWETKPGPHCSWCSVRQWCPDRDLFAVASAAELGSTESEEPPF